MPVGATAWDKPATQVTMHIGMEAGRMALRSLGSSIASYKAVDGMYDFKQLVLKHLAPSLGCAIAFYMYISLLNTVRKVRQQRHLGDLNPLPLVAILANCVAWLVYACMTQDSYVIMSNLPGLILSVYMTFSVYGYADHKARDLMLQAIMWFATLISTASVAIMLLLPHHKDRVSAAGYLAVGVLLIYYAAPLSALAEVLRSRSSATLYWPICLTSCINGSLWTTYGVAVDDPFIWGPNAMGALFGFVQLLLLGVFPSKPSTAARRAASAAALDEEDVVHTSRANSDRLPLISREGSPSNRATHKQSD